MVVSGSKSNVHIHAMKSKVHSPITIDLIDSKSVSCSLTVDSQVQNNANINYWHLPHILVVHGYGSCSLEASDISTMPFIYWHC